MKMFNGKRKISRLLIMIEDAPGQEGAVFDVTALVAEMGPKAKYGHADISIKVSAVKEYGAKEGEPQFSTELSFGGDAGEWVSGATCLDDVVNFAMPDGERVAAIKKSADRHTKKADSLRHDAMVEKLKLVAAIRHLHPVAQFQLTPETLKIGGSAA